MLLELLATNGKLLLMSSGPLTRLFTRRYRKNNQGYQKSMEAAETWHVCSKNHYNKALRNHQKKTEKQL